MNRWLLGASVFFGCLPLFAGTRVNAKTGGLLIPNDRGGYYLETRQWTRLTFKNPLVAKDAKVSLEILNKEGKVVETRDMGPIDDNWEIEVEQFRHGLGSPIKLSGLRFRFSITQPGSAPTTLGCKDDDDGIFTVSFAKMSDLPWKKTPTDAASLSEVPVGCSVR